MSKASQRFVALILMAFITLVGSAVEAQDGENRGAIAISAEIDAASVFVEGFFVGHAPVTVTGLPPGEYRVAVKGFEAGDYVADVAVGRGQTASVSAGAAVGQLTWRSPMRAEADWTPITEADQKRLESAKATAPLRAYQRLEIANFLVKSEQAVLPDHLFSIFGGLLKSIEDRKRLNGLELATNYSRSESRRWLADDSGKPTMVLSGVITKYERGSRAERYLIGFGAGRTRIYAVFRLVDKSSGEVLFERMENGSVSGGGFGGSSSGAMKELGEDIAKAIEREW